MGVVKGVESGEEMEGSLSFDLCLLSKEVRLIRK